MRLTEPEYHQYLKIHLSLMHYVGIQEKLLDADMSIEEFKMLPAVDKLPARNRIYEKPVYIDRFAKENPIDLSAEELDIVKAFKHFRRDKFYVVKYLKDYTVFVDEEYAYGVVALSDPLEKFWGDNLPLMVEAVLLPFKDRIVYDGIIQTYPLIFGSGMRASMRNDYNKAKAKYGIITSLPIDKEKVEFADEDKLRLYMKNAASREQNWYEIQELIEDNPSLRNLYHQLWGQVNARGKKKALKALGIKNYYFAIHNDVIVASGKTKNGLESQLKQLLKKDVLEAIYIFKV